MAVIVPREIVAYGHITYPLCTVSSMIMAKEGQAEWFRPLNFDDIPSVNMQASEQGQQSTVIISYTISLSETVNNKYASWLSFTRTIRQKLSERNYPALPFGACINCHLKCTGNLYNLL